LLVLINVSNE
jgi:hypothetical protein